MRAEGRVGRSRAVAIFFGGRSREHEASVHSAMALFDVIETLATEKIWVYVSRDGLLMMPGHGADVKKFLEGWSRQALAFDPPEYRMELSHASMRLIPSTSRQRAYSVDVVLPLLHGGVGEDGSFQGLCNMFAIPCAGPTVLGAAISLDKAICKSIVRDHGIAIARHMLVDIDHVDIDEVFRSLGGALIIKPRSEGSSVGVSFAAGHDSLKRALSLARQFGPQCLIEEYVEAIEVHCYVLRTRDGMKVSRISGTIPSGKIHSYTDKMDTPHAMKRLLAKDFSATVTDRVRRDADRVFSILDGWGLARLDFFLLADETILFNEINTIPGCLGPVTGVNPWKDYGLTFRDLLAELIEP
jgi:D-alanine-D-alanine ligase